MADDQIEQINKILSPKPGGTGDDVYKFANALDPRKVSLDELNAGAGQGATLGFSDELTDPELMMAEEFMNALPEEAKESFIDRLINDPKATIMSIMDTLGDAFGGGSGQIMDDLRDRGALSGINSGLIKGAGTMNVEGSGAMTDRELDAFRKMKMNMDVSPPSGPMTDRELDFIRQQQMDMNVSPPSGAMGAMTDEERAIRRQRMSMDN